ncbi:MAG TPA: ABC transporter substrate-binding protein [Microbacteriaceae bacterium]|jgi:ABC-type branched-chain amino acid transport systems, periplasmic component
MSPSRTLGVIAAMSVLTFGLVSCTPGPAPVPSPTPSASPSLAPLPAGDRVLRLGTLLPTTGASAFLAPAQAAGVELAVREINEAGGVLGAPIEVFHRNSGDASGDVLEKSFGELLAKKVDVVIGPSSSVLSARLLPKSEAAGVPLISPAAIAPGLSSAAGAGWFYRTVPSAALQGSALATILGKTSSAKVALVSFDDATGAALKKSLVAGLKASKGEVVEHTFDAGTKDLSTLVAAVVKDAPDAVVLVSPFSAMEQNKAIITALTAERLGGARLWLTSGNLADYSQALPKKTMEGVNGILEGAKPDAAFLKRIRSAGPTVKDYRYAAEAYDAVILAALAATVADNDSGAAVARNLSAVSSGGIGCTSYGECLDVLKTETDIDYNGASGPVGLDAAGDPASATFGVYRYDAANRYSWADSVTAG